MQRWLQFLFLLLTASALAHVPERKLISQLDDLNQTLAASYRYDPYGNTTYSSGSLAAANVYRFSSKEVHVNSGLYSYGYRFYSPNWQRWLNQDPIGEWGGINLYGFVGNEPLNSVDPNGLLFKEQFKKFGDWVYDKMMGNGEGQYDPNGNLAQRTAMLGNEGADTLQQMMEEGAGLIGDQGTDALAGGAAGKLAGPLLGAVCKGGKKLLKPGLIDDAAKGLKMTDDAAKRPFRSLSERIKDFKSNPAQWERVSASAEPAKAAKAKGGISIESVYKNKQTGETLNVHDVFTETGKDLPKHPSFRDYGKGD